MISIGEKIREARIARNLTQKELGNVLGLNEVLVGRLDAIYNEREKMFHQGNYEEVQFRDYEIFKNRYLKNYKIKYYLIENERIPGLIKRNK